MTTKICTRCKQDLPLTDYHRDKKSKGGHVSQCRVCVSLRQGVKHIPKSKTEGMKICTHCLRELPLDCFWKAKRGRLGRCADCKDCHRAYQDANAEYIREQHSIYRQKNSDKIKQIGREYYRANRAKILAYSSEYAKAHPEVRIRATQTFYKKHPERSRKHVILRRGRKLKAEGHFTSSDIDRQFQSQLGCCRWCSDPVQGGYHIDHVIPLSRGGSNWPDNLVIACPTCNLSKSDKLAFTEWIPPKPLY